MKRRIYRSDMRLESSYIAAYTDGREESIKRLYDWLMDENREPAQTFFSAGSLRNVAKEIEFRINETTKRSRR